MRKPLRAAFRLAMAAWIGAAGLVFLGASANAAAPENSLPDTTLLFIKVNNVKEFGEAFKRTSAGALWTDPAMKPLVDGLKDQLNDASGKVKEQIGIGLGELLTLPQGTISLAVTSVEAKVPVALLISADAGANKDKMATLMAKVNELAEKSGSKHSTESYKGVTLHTVAQPNQDDDVPLVWTQVGSVFHISSGAAPLKDVLSHADGRDDSLAKSENFAKCLTKIDGNGEFLIYFDIAQAIKLGVKAAGAAGGGGPDPAAILQILGLNGLKGFAMNVKLNSGPYDVLTKTVILAPGPSQGLMKIFTMPKRDLRPEPWVMASVAQYSSMSWDLDAAFNAINDLVNQFQPGALNIVEQQLVGPNGGEPLSIQKDIFGPLGDRISLISDFKKPITATSQRTLFGIALEDSKRFQSTLNKILALTGASPAKREFQGTTVYDFKIPQMPNQPGGGPLGEAISLAIAKDYVFIATQPSLLEAVLRGGGTALVDSPDYQRVAKSIPEQSITLTYENAEEAARASVAMLKGDEFENALKAGAGGGGPDLSKIAKFLRDKFPDYEVVAKYLTQGGGYTVSDDEATVSTSFALRRSNP